jgi:ribonuclease Z
MFLLVLACSAPDVEAAIIHRELARLEDTQTDGLRLIFGGTGTLATDADRAGSSIAVMAGEQVLVFDCGPGSTRVLGSSGVPLGQVSGVFVTHLHSDHYGDLGELTLATELLGREDALAVWGPEGIDQVVQGYAMAMAPDLDNRRAQHPGHLPGHASQVRPLVEGVVYDHEGLVVLALPVDHRPVEEAWAFRVEYEGHAVVLSGDTAHYQPLAEFAAGADVLVHEAMDKELAEKVALVADERGQHRTAALVRDALPNHSTPAEAADIAVEADVPTLVLTHISPPLKASVMRRRFLKQATDVFEGEVLLASDGMALEL